jgi:hypothetical protein
VRATLKACSPTWETQPATIWSTWRLGPALDRGALHGAEQIGRMHAGEAAAAAAERRTPR